ncbi:MAG: hypothetical protein LBD75_01710, partial [Candidatus Peribacteria bacterium]|nr:hypothetical protein [Candidatus Peribacteria bacterium]
LNLDILLPNFNFQPVKIDLPQIPNLPNPPPLQLNGDITLPIFPRIPAIPELPSPPHLPELPSFIPNIKIELPILPPAPALPEIPHTFEATLKFAETIGRIYCIIKQGIGLVGEGEVKAKIEQLTERTYEVPWIDKILDLTNIEALKPKLQGFDYEIDAQTNIQFNFSMIYAFLDAVTKHINNLSTSVVSVINEGTQAVEATLSDATNIAQDCLNDPTKCKNTAEQGRDNIEQRRENAGENIENEGKSFLGLTSDEITYTDYPQAKSRLESALAYFADEAQQDEVTTRKLQNIQTLLNTPSDIQANQQGIATIQQQITQLLTTQQEKVQLAKTTLTQDSLTQDYDQLLTALTTTSSLTSLIQESEQKQIAFNFNWFNADTTTKQLLTTMEHPYKILLDNKAPIIEGFLNEINTNSPELLNMTPAEYQRNKQTLTNLKHQLAGFYQRLQPQYQTTLQTKQSNQTAQKSLVAATTPTSSSSNQSMSFDPAAYINGIFAPTNSSPSNLTKVVYSEFNAEQIGTQYASFKLNNDTSEDIILWDSHNIYIKYGKQNDKFNGPNSTTTTYFMKKINNLPTDRLILSFNEDTRLKIFDYHEEVKNFAVKGQSFDALSFGRRQNWEPNVAGYLIKLTDRIDYSPEKADTKNNRIETYILVLPKDTDISGMQLAFPTKKFKEIDSHTITDEVQNRTTPELKEATKNRLIGEIRYFDPNQTNINVILENIERKRQYARISTLRNENKNNTLYISAPRSNQLVAGKQILGDDQGPQGQATLYRINTKEYVSTGEVLEGVVGTHYQLIIHRKDNVALATMQQEANGEILQTIETTNQT